MILEGKRRYLNLLHFDRIIDQRSKVSGWFGDSDGVNKQF